MNIIDKNSLSQAKRYWLNDANNLVTSLTKFYGKIRLDKISQEFSTLTDLEHNLLQVKDALVRQISLSDTDQTLVFARTIVPSNTYEYFTKELDSLGTKPIGDNLLFDKSKFNREQFIIRNLAKEDFLNETGISYTNSIYSRSSIFEYKKLNKLKFLITEYFLVLPKEYSNA